MNIIIGLALIIGMIKQINGLKFINRMCGLGTMVLLQNINILKTHLQRDILVELVLVIIILVLQVPHLTDQYDKSKYMPHMRGSTWYHKGMSSTNHQDPSSSYTAPNFELASNLTNATDNINDTTLTGGHTIYNSYHKRQQYAASRFRITTSNNWRSDGWNVNNGYFFFLQSYNNRFRTVNKFMDWN